MVTHCSLSVAHGDISNIHRDNTCFTAAQRQRSMRRESRDACNMVHCFNRTCQEALQTTPFEVMYHTCVHKKNQKRKKNRFESGRDACNMVHCFNRTCQAALQTTPFEVLYHTCEHFFGVKKEKKTGSNPLT